MDNCPICGIDKRQYLFVVHGLPVTRCPGCDLVSVFPFLSNVDHIDFYNKNVPSPSTSSWANSATEIEASTAYVEQLKTCGISQSARVLLVAPYGHPLIKAADESGVSITQHLTVEQIEEGMLLEINFDAAIILFQLEKSTQPDRILSVIRNALATNGLLFMVLPSLDSFSAHFLGKQWTEWRAENHFYFNKKTIQLLLWRLGFEQLQIKNDKRKYTIEHILDRARTFPRTLLTRSIQIGFSLIPHLFYQTRLRLPTSAITATARKGQINEIQICSIVLPTYNEVSTFSTLMDGLLEKQLIGIEKEIVIVESNSKDGTREQVLKYRDRPGVKIVLQDFARGKGSAVREGFAHASGDIILIQDADLEYDLNDYDALLEPIVNFRTPFVLGARHGGKWKMRQFDGQIGLSEFLNFGHVFFTSLLNILYGQRMRDPFTMFKVFRRDCLYNLKFECNRFDFDFELVIKLIRKGYNPLEIPVNYNSRSFKEGKKVNMLRDPITWIKAAFKYRFAKITKD